MRKFSSNEAAKKLGLSASGLSKYIQMKKISPPEIVVTGRFKVYLWTEADIERVREILPKIANGRKTRYQKQPKKQTTRKSKQ